MLCVSFFQSLNRDNQSYDGTIAGYTINLYPGSNPSIGITNLTTCQISNRAHRANRCSNPSIGITNLTTAPVARGASRSGRFQSLNRDNQSYDALCAATPARATRSNPSIGITNLTTMPICCANCHPDSSNPSIGITNLTTYMLAMAWAWDFVFQSLNRDNQSYDAATPGRRAGPARFQSLNRDNQSYDGAAWRKPSAYAQFQSLNRDNQSYDPSCLTLAIAAIMVPIPQSG